MDEEFLVWWENQLALAKRRLDGFWDKDPLIEVKKRDETVRPVGTVGEVFQRTKVGIVDVEKSAYEDERRILEQRVERLEKLLMPFETESFKKVKYGTSFEFAYPRMKVTVQEQPAVKKVNAEEIINRAVNQVVKGILRAEPPYATRGSDGRVFVNQLHQKKLILDKVKEEAEKAEVR